MITPLLQNAIARLESLSPSQQNCIATLVFEELASEQVWVKLLEKSPGQLEQMAIVAMREYNHTLKKENDESR